MAEKQRTRKQKAGWKAASAKELMGLSRAEAEYVEMHARLAIGVRDRRFALGLTQAELAERIGSSQSRVAKMEAGDSSVSLDLLVRTLLSLGLNIPDIAAMLREDAD